MSDEMEFFSLPPSRKSSSLGNGNGHKHTPQFAPPLEIRHDGGRKVNLKYAVFYLAVAALLILADRLARVSEAPNSNSNRSALQDVTLVLHSQAHLESQAGFIVRFRLSNIGKRAVFYPVHPGTNVPIGQIVTRMSASSGWTTLFTSPQQQRSTVPEAIDRNLSWIEMPPGGWVDGEFSEPGKSAEEYAYAIFLKADRDGGEVRVVSEPYRPNSK
jgi:hypothetical protein